MLRGAPKKRAIAALTGALALLAVPAFAGSQDKVHSHPKIKAKQSANENLLKGRVKSKVGACEKHRRLKLVLTRSDAERTKVTVGGGLRTNSGGKWKYKPKKSGGGDNFAEPGFYVAKVNKKTVGTDSGPVVCLKGSSDPLYVG